MSKAIILKLFDVVGIDYDGHAPDIYVKDETFYDDLLHYKTLGFGEAYMYAKFTTPDLEQLLLKLQKLNKLSLCALLALLDFWDYIYFLKYIFFKLYTFLIISCTNPQSIIASKKVGKEHYDLSNLFFAKMLDEKMLYSCGYWDDVKTLEGAQIAKTELVIQKLKIKPGDTILEIGSGWGYISYAIASKYPHCKVFGISISKEQITYCREKYNLPNLNYGFCDYRELQKNSYDKIYSVGMFEHVGYKNYNTFFDITYSLLKDNGVMLLHTITKHKQSRNSDPFFDKYIFAGGYLPSMAQVLKVAENTNYNIADLQEFGLYYALTLQAWLQNFKINFNELKSNDPTFYTPKFERMWELYLVMSKVGFMSGHLHLSQFVFTRNYKSVYIR